MLEFLLTCCSFVIFFLVILAVANIKQVNEYERALIFTLGKFSRIIGPGWHIIIPVFQMMAKVDIRTRTVDLAEQEAITKDNVSTRISAVLYYNIEDPQKAVLEVQYFGVATTQLAETTMRTVVGEFTLDELLAHRDKVANKIEEIVGHSAANWGVKIHGVELKDVILPETMKRTMAKQAEAERERRATIINSEGEVAAAENLSKAAKLMSDTPGALHLRTLNSINDISSDDSNTVIFMVPTEALKALEGFAKMTGAIKDPK
jgi:regulator of protease activity HflC (stomatin/prohibitin superfamily)